jgi:hypothetical protein
MNGTATFGDPMLAAAVRFAAHNPHYVRGEGSAAVRGLLFLNSFQPGPGISLESLEKMVFPFASRRGLKYR